MAVSNILALGNPGAGKSTILNILLGKPQFEAGVSIGAGLTKELKRAELDGVAYYDVPGLSDASFRVEAAAATTDALRQGGSSKVFFTVTLENGRTRPDDAVTIRTILMAAPSITGYGVVVNNLPPPVALRLADPAARQLVIDSLMEIIPRSRRTAAFFFQPLHQSLYCLEHYEVDYAACQHDFAELAAFVRRDVPLCVIPPAQVTPVDPASFAQMQASYSALKQQVAAEEQRVLAEAAERARAEQAARVAAQRAAEEAERARQAERARAAAAEAARQAEAARAAEAERARQAAALARQAEEARAAEQRRAWQAERERDAAWERAWRAQAAAAAREEQEVQRRLMQYEVERWQAAHEVARARREADSCSIL